VGHDDVDIKPNQFRRQGRQLVIPSLGPAELDHNILAFGVAEVAQPLTECRSVRLSRGCRFRREQDTDARHSPGRLRLSGERRGEEAASKGADEGSPVDHSIT